MFISGLIPGLRCRIKIQNFRVSIIINRAHGSRLTAQE
jgi:hypothetical protein